MLDEYIIKGIGIFVWFLRSGRVVVDFSLVIIGFYFRKIWFGKS